MTTPTVDIVIVTYQCRNIIDDCLAAIFDDPDHIAWSVHVVDNCSPDGTADHISSTWPDVELIRRSSNDGFGAANNSALRRSTAEFVLLLNPDAILERGAVGKLLHWFREPRIGVVGCRLVQQDGSFDHAAKRRFPTPSSGLSYLLGRGNSSYTAPDVPESGVGDVDAVNGAFMLIRGDALRDVGMFDEQFWMYGEDLDLCRRFHDAGWRTLYDGTVVVTHLKSAISGKHRSPRLNWHFHKSMALYYRKHDAGRNVVLDLAVYSGIALRAVLTTMRDAYYRSRHS